jgi:hypothetical protein
MSVNKENVAIRPEETELPRQLSSEKETEPPENGNKVDPLDNAESRLMGSPGRENDRKGSKDSHRRLSGRKKSIQEQASELWSNQLFCRCAVAFAMVNFTVAGIQFLWVRLYTGLWGVSKSAAVMSQLLIVALGGGTGVALSSAVKFTDSPAGKQRLSFTTKAFALAGCGAVIAAGGVLLQLCAYASRNITLCLVYGGVFIICTGLNMTPGILQIICMESVDLDQTRSFGAGVYQALNNFLGLGMGPCIPQLVMSVVCNVAGLQATAGKDPHESLCAGFICACCGVFVSLGASSLAWCAARDETELQAGE